ncbi:MAG TPA: hypothetical protein DD477_05325 [Spirochaetaceae bacterium]|nr:hypothetical protein [Spirochaetaceae bacterium]
MRSDKWCLVLSGGGAKGVYHIGAWQALRKLGIRPEAFIGNSIGAIIAACMAQDCWRELERVIDGMDFRTFFDVPPDLIRDGKLDLQHADGKDLRHLARSLVSHHGIDTTPLRTMLEGLVDEARIRRSGRDLGIVTVNLSELRACELFLDDIPDGRLVEFLLASSALPGLKPLRIDNQKYLDGGLYDNIPYSMARHRGYRNIIVIDVSGIGVVRKHDFSGARVMYIRNSITMGGVLDFGPDFLRDYQRLGYLDTMRAFGALHGWLYFVNPTPILERRFADFLVERHGGVPDKLRKLTPASVRSDRRHLLKLLEAAAASLNIPRLEQYSYRRLADLIHERRQAEEAKLAAFLTETGRPGPALWEELVVQPLKSGQYRETPYYYQRLIALASERPLASVLRRLLAANAPQLALGLHYFELVGDFWQRRSWVKSLAGLASRLTGRQRSHLAEMPSADGDLDDDPDTGTL